MSNKIIFSSMLIAVLAIGMISFTTATEGDPSSKEIIQKAESKFRGNSSKAEMTMKIVRPKWTREITMKSWSLGEDYSLMKITYPARDKGMGYLKRSNEIWSWQPKINRMIKLPPSMMMQSWMGSDLTNDDLVRQSSIVDDYTHKLAGKQTVGGRNCYKIVLIPKEDAAVVWGKVIMWIDTKDYLQMKTEFYDEDEYLTNTIVAKNIKRMDDRIIPTVMEVIPAEEPGNKTILTYKSIDFNVSLKSSFFSQQNLKRIR